MSEVLNLQGRTVAVTGGATGIGLETAKHLAGAGAKVAIGDLDLPGAEEAANSSTLGLPVTSIRWSSGSVW